MNIETEYIIIHRYAYKRFCTRTKGFVRVQKCFVRVQKVLYAYKRVLYAYKMVLYAYIIVLYAFKTCRKRQCFFGRYQPPYHMN